MLTPISSGMRWLLRTAGFLVLLAGFQLFILTEFTDQYFAWTIKPFITAAFLGGGYFASCLLEFLASRRGKWVEARIAVPAVFTFTTLTLIATLLHLDRFHFNSPSVLAWFAAWFWLAIYATVPLAMLVMWILQHRLSKRDEKSSTSLPVALRFLLAAQSVIMLVWGVSLFVDPSYSMASWPWMLTPLTSQAIGAWLIGIGVLAAHTFIENQFSRVRIALISFLAFGILEIIALIRYPGSFDWSEVSGRVYLALVGSMLLTGLFSMKSGSAKH
ncbi:MAG TPA: hypothetical protein VLV18_00400 [Terriglobales bacterium]|nr:hypothetical protein [Terriglobales bacterium]